ncbi:hypothetical protein NHQ30_008010 [Ciborinia camelliae]|nr:hypothetical protein NHQ30_008010 [Ciborinia camelliae]
MAEAAELHCQKSLNFKGDKEFFEWLKSKLEPMEIEAEKYNSSMSGYSDNPNDKDRQDMEEAKDKITLGIGDLKSWQGMQSNEGYEAKVSQSVDLFEKLIRVELSLEERIKKYKDDNNSWKAWLLGLVYVRKF